ncbi:tetratricopeptide repeat protein [Leptodesmis sichuanensis]|uniref:tetratricopeptide repeat protein n=1 Tax=Leptodesmis sichuanensis TaxID=2906798 RepID=UPI001F343B33|nr:tetratricopeptide repeat protein [Leptodesmis sichuanensis]UIE36372.1 tetratricopeptide repeat protein [Leptodesmis sichuanensis A121]
MTKLQPSSLLTAAVLGLVFFNPGNALAIAAIRPHELTHQASTSLFMAQASATQYLEQGIQLIEAGDFRGAEAAFRKAIQLDPNNATAHYSLGVALAAQGKPEEAIAEFR